MLEDFAINSQKQAAILTFRKFSIENIAGCAVEV